MYLRTPKKYAKRQRRLINLKWLWLYILAPIIIIPASVIWYYRGPISQSVSEWAVRNIRIDLNTTPPTPTPAIPAADLRRRFESYVQAGSMKNAIQTLGSYAAARPNEVEAYTTLTKMLLFRDDSPAGRNQALIAAEGALNANPEAPDGWIMMGMTLNALGHPQEALPYLLRARDFDSRNPALLTVLAETYDNLERPDRALQLVEEGIETAKAAQPVDPVMLAYAYVVKGRLALRERGDQAVTLFEEAWRVAQTDSVMPVGYIAQWLWSYYFNVDEIDRIVEVLTFASNRDKDDPINPYLLGRTYIKTGDKSRALSNLERCRDLDPDQVKCLRWLATMMYRENNLQRAAELGQRAIDLGTDDPGAFLVAGAAYAYTSRCTEAVPILQQGLGLAEKDASLAGLVTQFRDALRSCGAPAVSAPLSSYVTAQPGQ